ncbi:MAG: aminotransferase, partial [Ruminococcus sp.]|nr:aminotransferase [Ruminococcus sp.]
MTKSELQRRYNNYITQGLRLDISRGKPAPQQLDLSLGILSITDYKSEDGTDLRNYGLLDGIPEAKRLFADMLDVSPENVIVCGN